MAETGLDGDVGADVLVVGAGSAGCAIAARASEDPRRSVLVVEAGPDYPDPRELPFDLINSHNNSYRAHDWGLRHEPSRGREVDFPRGRVVGGSSAVNTTIALRGVPEDYDEWASLGADGWAWQDVLPAFKRLERDLDFGAADYHGDAGPISIRRYRDDELLPQHQAFLAAAERLDYPACPDANRPDDYGAGPQPMNKLGRLRISCALGYLAPARARPNLRIRPDTLVRRLLLERGRCVGVEIEATGTAGEREVRTLKAPLVVLAAGALMSPAILLRSGLGPRTELQRHGIEVVRDLPGVGANLRDHPALSVAARVRDGVAIDHDAPIIQTILRYTCDGSDKRNDLQIEQLSFAGRRSGEAAFAIAAVLEYQFGAGELRLASADPAAAPIVDNRFCEDPRDMARLVRCYRDALAFAAASPLADMIDAIVFPREAAALTDADIERLIHRFAGSGYHPSGTVKMGAEGDPMAVVDARCRAHQVPGLVVADASIMPTVPRANTNLTSIMIGERVGEWLRTDAAGYGL
ncbi:MAG: GMC family oxidoreductase N-terminal domain-containing protein [Pseudomonadota bacterium]